MKASLILACLFAALLIGCGGGDPEDDGHVQVGPPDCRNHPEACK